LNGAKLRKISGRFVAPTKGLYDSAHGFNPGKH
jgi:hypothetical protein